MRYKFTVVALDGPMKQVACVTGRFFPEDNTLTLGDMRRVIEVEQLLERLTGYRWHIQSEPIPDVVDNVDTP